MIVYAIKKNRVWYQHGINVGLKINYSYADILLYAKFFEKQEEAEHVCKNLNDKNALPHIKGSWKVKTYKIEEI